MLFIDNRIMLKSASSDYTDKSVTRVFDDVKSEVPCRSAQIHTLLSLFGEVSVCQLFYRCKGAFTAI